MWRNVSKTSQSILPSLLITFFGTFLSASVAVAQTPAGVRIQSMDAFGSGCPSGSYSGTISPDAQAFSLLLDNFVAETSMQNPIVRLSCQLRVKFQVPRGWTFAVVSADYRGFAYAEANTTATHQALYSFDGSQPPNERPGYQNGKSYVFRVSEFVGPHNDNYTIHQELDPKLAPWTPCNQSGDQTLYLTTFLMARNFNLRSNISAQITLDSIDGSVQSQKYKLMWRTCNVGPVRPGQPRQPDPIPDPGRDNPRPDDPGRPGKYPPTPTPTPTPGRPRYIVPGR